LRLPHITTLSPLAVFPRAESQLPIDRDRGFTADDWWRPLVVNGPTNPHVTLGQNLIPNGEEIGDRPTGNYRIAGIDVGVEATVDGADRGTRTSPVGQHIDDVRHRHAALVHVAATESSFTYRIEIVVNRVRVFED